MRIDQTAASMHPRSLNEQLNHVIHLGEALAQLACLHWAKWDTRSQQHGLTRSSGQTRRPPVRRCPG
jgi:hypothetical protein